MTTAEITVLRDAAKAAYTKALDAASYSVNSGGASRSISRQNINDLKKEYLFWESRLAEANGTKRRIKFVTHRD